MSIIALIPARSGSVGIPNKNVRLLGGKPLLVWSVEHALGLNMCDRVVCSAGNEETARIARDAGAEAFVRAPWLNEPDAPMVDVVRDVIRDLYSLDIVVLLQPTTPFRERAHTLRAMYTAMEQEALDSSFTVLKVPDRYHPRQQVKLDPDYPVCRQYLEPAFVRAGTVYVFRPRAVWKYSNIYGRSQDLIVIPEHEALNLDTMQDWDEAERRVKAQNQACA